MFSELWAQYSTRRLLDRAGLKQMRDVRVADGIGGEFCIERLLLRQHGLSVLTRLRYEGIIFCAENIDTWTQLVDGKSYSFANPLTELDHQVAALAGLLPSVAVDGYLFFDHRASFPKGHPQRVIQRDSMPDALQRVRGMKPDAAVMAAWQQLVEARA